MASPARSTSRGALRRQQLLRATADLVSQSGFHAVGIADIGAAAGVTGAAIYRHFSDKTQLLVALFDNVVDQLLDGSASITAAGTEASETLAALIRHHVDFALRERTLIAVYSQQAHSLPDADRSRLRRNQRVYVLRVSTVLREVMPAMPAEEARTRVQATFGLLNSTADFPNRLPREDIADLFASMALAALLAPSSCNDVNGQ